MSERRKFMPVTDSPLRYPGCKTKIYDRVKKIIDDNMLKTERIYVEPYAGGAGLALKLLYKGDVQKLVLNDFDYHIFCFWHVCLQETDALCELIDKCDINIEEWNRQKEIYENVDKYSEVEIGFATFYLNRCNVSGIIKGGPIGGADQKGKYKMDARFNKIDLIRKIKKVASYRNVIEIYNMDAIDFFDVVIKAKGEDNVFFNIDPPYVKKGPMLYKNSYSESDHRAIALKVATLNVKWIVTYDECELIENLYSRYRMEKMQLNYSAGNTKTGQEYIVYSDLIKMGDRDDRKTTDS